jgi:hypothetical protein
MTHWIEWRNENGAWIAWMQVETMEQAAKEIDQLWRCGIDLLDARCRSRES